MLESRLYGLLRGHGWRYEEAGGEERGGKVASAVNFSTTALTVSDARLVL
jgi:hypothetical protein